MGCLQHKPCRDQGCKPAPRGPGQDWVPRPELKWVSRAMGGERGWGLLGAAAQRRWGSWVCSGPCPAPSHPPCRNASPPAIWTLLLIFLGSKQSPKIHLQVSFPRAGCERLPLEATVLPGDTAPQIPGSSPEPPCKKIQTDCSGQCLLGGSGITDGGDKDDSGLVFVISV